MHIDHSHAAANIGGGDIIMKNSSPIESRSDRSECSFTSSKLDVCSKSDEALTDLPENMLGNTSEPECNMENSIYQSCGEENVSSKLADNYQIVKCFTAKLYFRAMIVRCASELYKLIKIRSISLSNCRFVESADCVFIA